MEVSQQSDHVTHAAIGAKETVQMGVSNSATLMHVLSTALYTHPMLASVREPICNGWDAHIVGGITDIPLQITINDTMLKIRDFGSGIPHEKIGEIYGTYGNSTKRHDGQQTGGFGLGSKAPFAYTDNFEVINHCDGIKAVYRVNKSSMSVDGSPSIDTIVKVPTTETGIQVSVNIKSYHDRSRLEQHIREILMLGEIKAVINGAEQPAPVLPLSESHTGYIISSATGTLLDTINVRYGNVVYPVPRIEGFEDIWDSVTRVVRGLWDNANVVFMAKPDTITINPSREALIYTEGTIRTIKDLLASFNPNAAKSSPVTSRQITMTQVNQNVLKERISHPGELVQTMQLTAARGTNATFAGGVYNFDARKAAVSFAISRRSLHIEGRNLVHKRLKNAIFHGLVPKEMGKKFLCAGQRYDSCVNGKAHWKEVIGLTADGILRKALHKHVTWPLMEAIKANDGIMEVTNIHYAYQRYRHHEHMLVNPWRMTLGDPQSLYGFLTPRILLARSKKAIKEFLVRRRLFKEPGQDLTGWMVYQLPASDKNYDKIRKVFEDLGYQVHTYLPVVERVERVKKSDDPNYVAPVKKATPKRKGYLTLRSARSYDNHFTLARARETCKPEDHVFDPIAYVVLSSGSECQRKRWPTIQDAGTCRKIEDVFGDKIAVITSTQAEKLEKQGIPELSKFIYKHVDETLAASPDFPRYLAFGRHVRTEHGRPEGAQGILQGLTQHHELAATLPGKPFRFCVSPQTLAYSRLFEDRNFRDIGMEKSDKLGRKVKRSPQVNELLLQIDGSPWKHYVDLDAVAGALHRKAPNDDTLAIPYQIVTHLMTPMETQQ